MNKYHSGGLWTNTCCSHPFPGEDLKHAAERRLYEEMGITCQLRHAFHFIYHAHLDCELIEHELDHVFIGTTDDIPRINTNEVNDFAYVNLNKLQDQLSKNPELFTVWFKIIFSRFRDGTTNLFYSDKQNNPDT